MRGDRRRAGAILPETMASLRTGGNKTLRAAPVGRFHNLGGSLRHLFLHIARHVHQKHHLGQISTRRLAGVTHRVHVPLVQVLHAGQHDARLCFQILFGFNDGGHRATQIRIEEFQADRADELRRRMQNKDRRGDQPVTALLLNAWQTAQELVGNVLAEALLAQLTACDAQGLRFALRGDAVCPVASEAKLDGLELVDFA